MSESKKLTAKIIRSANIRDFAFRGTKAEYYAECDKYGYRVISDITEEEDPEAWREEYLAKQAAGARYEKLADHKHGWIVGRIWDFSDGNKEDYREVQEAPKPTIPHAAERALYWAQRAAGTDEVWQFRLFGVEDDIVEDDIWSDVIGEPAWDQKCLYRPKPKTVTYYFAMVRYKGGPVATLNPVTNKHEMNRIFTEDGWEVIGNIESREVEIG